MRTIEPLDDEANIRDEALRNTPSPPPVDSNLPHRVSTPLNPPVAEVSQPVAVVPTPPPASLSVPKKKSKKIIVLSIVIVAALGYLLLQAYIAGKMIGISSVSRDGGSGWSAKEAITAWQRIDGVENVKIFPYYWHLPPDGKSWHRDGNHYVMEVKIDPEYHISDRSVFLEYAANTLWALEGIELTKYGSRYPGDMIISVAGGVTSDYVWDVDSYEVFHMSSTTVSDSILKDHGDTPPYSPSGDFSSVIRLEPYAIEGRFGVRVANPPSMFKTFIKKGAPVPVTYDAIESHTLRRTSDSCYVFTVNKWGYEDGGKHAHEWTNIDVTVDGQTVAKGGRQAYMVDIEFCLNEQQKKAKAIRAHVTMPASGIYREVDNYYTLDVASAK